MNDVKKRWSFIVNTAYFALWALIAWLVYKFAFGVCFPLVFAFAVAAILQRPKNFIVRKTFLPKGITSTLSVFIFYGVFVAALVLIGIRIGEEIKDFVNYLISLFSNIDQLINTVEDFVLSFVSRLPEFVSESARSGVLSLFTQIRELAAGTSTELTDTIADGLGSAFSVSWITTPLSGVISTVSQIPSVLIGIVITIVATCFMTAEYDYIVNFIKIQFPREKRENLTRAKNLLKNSLSKMGKAYGLIILITFSELFIGFSILDIAGIFRSDYKIILAVIIAIIDIVPVLGTGTVLIPWTAYSLIVGNYSMALGLIIMYAVITVIRQIIEPKLVAGQLGLSPVITISAMYLGLKLMGFMGIFIAPIVIIMLKLLTDEGILHIWRSPVREAAREKQEAEKSKAEAEAEAEKKAEESTEEK